MRYKIMNRTGAAVVCRGRQALGLSEPVVVRRVIFTEPVTHLSDASTWLNRGFIGKYTEHHSNRKLLANVKTYTGRFGYLNSLTLVVYDQTMDAQDGERLDERKK